MYGVLYALSPEVFPTKDRGTGNALVASANRIFGIMVIAWISHSEEKSDSPSRLLSSHYTPTLLPRCRSTFLVWFSCWLVSLPFFFPSSLVGKPRCSGCVAWNNRCSLFFLVDSSYSSSICTYSNIRRMVAFAENFCPLDRFFVLCAISQCKGTLVRRFCKSIYIRDAPSGMCEDNVIWPWSIKYLIHIWLNQLFARFFPSDRCVLRACLSLTNLCFIRVTSCQFGYDFSMTDV
jgi:hypothetical protein